MRKYFTVSNILTFFLFAGLAFFFLYQKGFILTNFENLSPEKAYNLLQKEKDGIVLIDVRTPEEVLSDGKIPDSILIPLDQLGSKIDMLKPFKNKKILVYCRSGNRSVSASRFLSSLGFKVYNIRGGINEWKEQGFPIEKEEKK